MGEERKVALSVTPEERKRIEDELERNGYVTIDDVPFTVKQLALLNHHNIRELGTKLDAFLVKLDADDGFVRTRVLDDYRRSMRTMMSAVTGLIIGLITVGIMLVSAAAG